MPPRTCVVTLTDSRGIRHSVEVTAESLFEAGILAVSAFRKAGWVEEPPGVASRLEIEIREPACEAHGDAGAASALGEWSNEIACGANQARADARTARSHHESEHTERTLNSVATLIPRASTSKESQPPR